MITHRVILKLDKDGFKDLSGVYSVGFVPWKEVASIQIIGCFITVKLKKNSSIPERCFFYIRSAMRKRMKKGKPAFAIDLTSSDVDYKEVFEIMQRMYAESKQGVQKKQLPPVERAITVGGCSQEDLKVMLHGWSKMYADQLNDNIVFEYAQIKSNTFLIKPDASLDDELYFFLINYLTYSTELKKTLKVDGYAYAGTTYGEIANKNIHVFVEADDKYHDRVWITDEDQQNYVCNLGGGFTIIESDRKYVPPTDSTQFRFETISVDIKLLKHS